MGHAAYPLYGTIPAEAIVHRLWEQGATARELAIPFCVPLPCMARYLRLRMHKWEESQRRDGRILTFRYVDADNIAEGIHFHDPDLAPIDIDALAPPTLARSPSSAAAFRPAPSAKRSLSGRQPMADGTKIEWTDATWNPITGCSIVSPGCTNCYAMKLAGSRLKNHSSREGLTRDTKAGPVWTGEVRFNPQWLDQPLRWRKPRMIFVCAHGDLFAEGVPDEWIDQVFAVMAAAHWHTFQVLTKRPGRMRDYLTRSLMSHRIMAAQVQLPFPIPSPGRWSHMPLPNVWLGVSTEDQKRADERIPILLQTPAALHWISAEPLLGPIDPRRIVIDHPAYAGVKAHLDALSGQIYDLGDTLIGDPGERTNRLKWVVAGGENGPRPMHPHWGMDLRDFSAAAGVPFLFKQWGSWLPDLEDSPTRPADHPEQSRFETCVWDPDENRWEETNGSWDNREQWVMADTYQEQEQGMTKVGKRGAGRLLGGVEHNGFPEVRR